MLYYLFISFYLLYFSQHSKRKQSIFPSSITKERKQNCVVSCVSQPIYVFLHASCLLQTKVMYSMHQWALLYSKDKNIRLMYFDTCIASAVLERKMLITERLIFIRSFILSSSVLRLIETTRIYLILRALWGNLVKTFVFISWYYQQQWIY